MNEEARNTQLLVSTSFVLMVASIATLKAIILWNVFSVASARYHRINFPSSFVVLRSNSLRRSIRVTANAAMANNNLPPPNKQDNDDEGHNNDENGLDQKIENLLDKPLFDPYAPSNDNNWFANLENLTVIAITVKYVWGFPQTTSIGAGIAPY
jgi:hypothetical protein